MFLPLKDSLIIFTSAFLDSLNPCAISVLIITLAFLFSLKKEKKFILTIGLTYIFFIFLTYFLIGLGILKFFQFLDPLIGSHLMAKITAIVLIFYGIVEILNVFFKNFPLKLKIPEFSKNKIGSLIHKASFPSFALLGILVGLTETPCTGGPYFFVLGLLHHEATYLQGLFYLFIYNLIFVLPLFLIIFLSSNEKILNQLQEIKRKHLKTFRTISGFIFILFGLFVIIYY